MAEAPEACIVDTINVEQAVFASTDRGKIKGYQLVSQSDGVDRTIGQELCRWAPTRVSWSDPTKWTLNYFRVSDDAVAVTRTVLGGPEYSGRGGMQVVTLILVLRRAALASYGYNPIAVAKTALAMGYLRLPLEMTRAPLPPAVLPSRPIVDWFPTPLTESEDDASARQIAKTVELLREGRRVAMIGTDDPMEVMECLMPKLTVETRQQFSFSTGLAPAVRRPFQLHFLPSVDVTMQRTLDAQNIDCVTAE